MYTNGERVGVQFGVWIESEQQFQEGGWLKEDSERECGYEWEWG